MADQVADFASLMQGATLLQQPQLPQTPPKASAAITPEAAPDHGADTELNLATPEGIMAVLDQTIAALQATGGQVTQGEALAAFANALGSSGAETVRDIDAVSALGDEAFTAALQDRITVAFPVVTTLNQLRMAAAHVPAVERAAKDAGVVKPATPSLHDAVQKIAMPQTPIAPAGAEVTIAEPRHAKTGDPVALQPAGIKTEAVAGLVPDVTGSAVTETATKEVQAASGGTLQLLPEMKRITPAPVLAAPPQVTADEQLRQHVGQHIRSALTGESSFRFSLSPYGMGDIEIELVRAESGRVQIAMTTETASVLSVLRQDRDLLLDALQTRGISAELADLDFQTFDERGRQGQDRARPERSGSDGQSELPEADPAPATAAPIGIGHLDILT